MNAPPSITLAIMAAKLAGVRVCGNPDYVFRPGGWCAVPPRETLALPLMMQGSREYYRIIDRISAGEAP